MRIVIETVPHNLQRYPTLQLQFYFCNALLQIFCSLLPLVWAVSVVASREIAVCTQYSIVSFRKTSFVQYVFKSISIRKSAVFRSSTIYVVYLQKLIPPLTAAGACSSVYFQYVFPPSSARSGYISFVEYTPSAVGFSIVLSLVHTLFALSQAAFGALRVPIEFFKRFDLPTLFTLAHKLVSFCGVIADITRWVTLSQIESACFVSESRYGGPLCA